MQTTISDLLKSTDKKVLFYGIGNVGRSDDGLGIRFVEKLQEVFEASESHTSHFTFEMNYQLNIEDALLISEYDIVIFVDATKEDLHGEAFKFQALKPLTEITFTTHAMNMESIVGLCEQMYHKSPQAYSLAIQGYHWEINDSLSEKAEQNLKSLLS